MSTVHRTPNGSPVPIPSGRPRGSRNLISRRILEDITEAWQEHGAASLRILAREDPGKFAALGVAILPRDILVSIEQAMPGNLDPEDWRLMLRVLDIIKECVPAETEAAPDEVFDIIETALRTHYATLVGC